MAQWRKIGLALLGIGGMTAFGMQVQRSGDLTEVHAGLRALGDEVISHQERTGQWPSGIETTAGQDSALQVSEASSLDPWDQPYVYGAGRVTSLGSDQDRGGTGDAADHAWDISRGRCSCGAR